MSPLSTSCTGTFSVPKSPVLYARQCTFPFERKLGTSRSPYLRRFQFVFHLRVKSSYLSRRKTYVGRLPHSVTWGVGLFCPLRRLLPFEGHNFEPENVEPVQLTKKTRRPRNKFSSYYNHGWWSQHSTYLLDPIRYIPWTMSRTEYYSWVVYNRSQNDSTNKNRNGRSRRRSSYDT